MRPLTAAGVALIALAVPPVTLAHGLQGLYQSPLPLPVYLVGAAATVGLSFAFVLARDVRAGPATAGRLIDVPAPLRLVLRAIGLVGWLWIVVQGIVGGSSDAEVATLFLWVYGWVGLAAISALVGPLWQWLDPFATLHDLGAALLRSARIPTWQAAELPASLRGWPAVIGFVLVVWLELVQGGTANVLFVTLVAYTAFTLAMMAQFGRDSWRAHGEIFSVWFRILGRLAPLASVPAAATAGGVDGDVPDEDAIDASVVRRRPFASGLMEVRWSDADIVLVAVATGSILYDGLSQTRPFAIVFGAPSLPFETLLLGAFLGLIATAALTVARTVSRGAIGAGLVPISVGYLIAHYLTYLLVDGQRIVIAISDPLQQGSDLFGTAFYVPSGAFLAPGLTWTIQLAAVVGGHMLGAWSGHVVANRDAEQRRAATESTTPARSTDHAASGPGRGKARSVRAREVPLAVVMVALTTLTLWSLGQAIVVTQNEAGAIVRGAG